MSPIEARVSGTANRLLVSLATLIIPGIGLRLPLTC